MYKYMISKMYTIHNIYYKKCISMVLVIYIGDTDILKYHINL